MAEPDREAALEGFRQATSGAARAISHQAELEVEFGSDGPMAAGSVLHLRAPAASLPYADVARVRGQADAAAVRLRHHDAAMHARGAPRGDVARRIYDRMEQTRCEALGARHMSGVAENLSAALEERYRAAGYDAGVEGDEAALPDVLALLAREAITGRRPPASASRVVDMWRPDIEQKVGRLLHELESECADQKDFAGRMRAILEALGFPDEDASRLEFKRGRGCVECLGTGYRGQTGIFEVMRATDTMRKLILDSPGKQALHQEAIRAGMTTMSSHALSAIKAGLTTPEEFLKNIVV